MVMQLQKKVQTVVSFKELLTASPKQGRCKMHLQMEKMYWCTYSITLQAGHYGDDIFEWQDHDRITL